MKAIPVGQGHETLVSEEDYLSLIKFKWHLRKKPDGRRYAVTTVTETPVKGQTKQSELLMHRLILNCPRDFGVDHMNGNGLDNRRENIRIATASENCRSFQRKSSRSTSKYRGVSHKNTGKWEASLSLGQFDTETEAAQAFDRAVALLFGGLVQLNFPVTPRSE